MVETCGLLPIRLAPHGWVAVQDGVLLTFFVRAPHHEVAEPIGDLYDRWLQIVGPDSVQWVRGRDDWNELTPRRRTAARKLLSGAGARKPDVRVAVKGATSSDDVMAHGFDYWSRDGEVEGPDTAAGFVELRFTTEWVRERGLETFYGMAIDLARGVPFSSGYASLAFHTSLQIPGFIDARAFRHPGMDVHANEYTALYIGDAVRGAYWLTFVGPVALAELGSAEALRGSLAPGITMTEIGDGVVLRAGDELRPGDVDAGDRLPLTRAVARALEPVTLHQTLGAFGFTTTDRHEQFLAWQRRHLE